MQCADGQGRAPEAARLGCADTATQVACMRAKPVAGVLAAGGGSLGSFGPVVGGAVLPQQIPDAISSGQFNQVPVMEGTNHDEYRLFVAALFDLQGNPVTAAQYPALLQARFGAGAAKVLATYPLAEFPSPSVALATVVTDAAFACPARAADGLLAAHVRTFAYEFNDPNAPEFLITDPVMPLRAFHAAEIPYVFQPADAAALFNADQLALSEQMIGYWSRFAATATPTGRARPVGPVTPPAPTRCSLSRPPPPDRSPPRRRPPLRLLGLPGRLTDPGPAGGNGAAGRAGSAERPFEHFAL